MVAQDEDIEGSVSVPARRPIQGAVTQFDFSKDSTKLIYAGVKLIVALCLTGLYFPVKSVVPAFAATQPKSILLFSALVVLSIYRDKHEKKIASTYDPQKLHFGRALLTPVIYVSFTLMMIIEQSMMSFVIASMYQLGYFYFYFDEARELLMGETPKQEDQVRVFNTDGGLNMSGFFSMAPSSSGGAVSQKSKGIFLGMGSLMTDFLVKCWQKEDSRKMLIFTTINMLFMFVELGYGIYSNSLGLISDSFHMFSDCLSLFVALGASYISLGDANQVYTFGYVRAETLSGLFNGIFLVFVAFNVFTESIERIYEP